MKTGRMYLAMTEGLREEKWKYVELPDAPSVLLTVETSHGYLTCYGEADEAHDRVLFHTRYGVKVPVHRRIEVAEYLTRANWNLIAGNFDFDFDTGTVRFRTASAGCPITSQVIRSLVLSNLEAADTYLPGFLAVSAGTLSPRKAIELTELIPLEEVLAQANEDLNH
jgi:hypothetical protein